MPQFDRVVVVSLARRPDRLEAFRGRLAAAWPGTPLDVFPAVDGRLCQPPDWWNGGAGAWGCYRSHQRILEEAVQDGLGSVLVFEDDAAFVPGFAGRLEAYLAALPAGPCQAYLGGQHLKPAVLVNDQVVRCTNCNRTHGYAVLGAEAILRLYRWLHAGAHWRGRHHVDHHYGRQHPSGVPAYAPREWLVGQAAAGPSDVSRGSPPDRWWPLEDRLCLPATS